MPIQTNRENICCKKVDNRRRTHPKSEKRLHHSQRTQSPFNLSIQSSLHQKRAKCCLHCDGVHTPSQPKQAKTWELELTEEHRLRNTWGAFLPPLQKHLPPRHKTLKYYLRSAIKKNKNNWFWSFQEDLPARTEERHADCHWNPSLPGSWGLPWRRLQLEYWPLGSRYHSLSACHRAHSLWITVPL